MSSHVNSLVLERVSHRFGNVHAVDDVSLTVGTGEIVCLVGPSGCGKTTLLRIAAGVEELQHGRVQIGGQVVAGAEAATVAPEDRGVGLVFQDYALFPHLSVLENVTFGLDRLRGAERRARAREVLEQVGIAALAEAYPHTLSGGEQQRVALARALAPRPRIVLLDEPFSGLDARLRNRVRDETLHLLKNGGASTLMVTHDPEEAMFMADRIALMRAGRLAQVGTPADMYYHPVDVFVAEFFGEVNRMAGIVEGGQVSTPLGTVTVNGVADGTPVRVLIRPEDLQLRRLADCEAMPERTGVVQAARLLGRTSLVHLSLKGPADGPLHLHARVPGSFLPAENDVVALFLDSSQAFVFPNTDT